MIRRFGLAAAAAAGLLSANLAAAEPAMSGKATDGAERADNPSRMDPGKSRRMALARRYMEAMHYRQTVAGVLKSLMPALLDNAGSHYGALSERERKALTDSCLEAMDALTPEMVDDAVAAMSDVLTEDELTQLAAFYESPVGQSIVAKNAQISAAMAGPMRAMMPKVSAQILKRFCARIDCSTLPKPPPPQQS
ncbi:DUF2059 domain-containing protein [Caulobacter sp. KR2-114]|uniref:DUF2059 domain-containing protein n=1 Tax=Caulobacter sp. KR2-114 TaxID=3400912 RepID=UPI003C0C0710